MVNGLGILFPLKPLPGVDIAVIDDHGHAQSSGYLVITSPWPSMLRGLHKDPIRYKETYWKKWNGGYYFTGDGVKRDDDGYFWLSGRVDDVINEAIKAHDDWKGLERGRSGLQLCSGGAGYLFSGGSHVGKNVGGRWNRRPSASRAARMWNA